jgi:hypothetical protein
MTTVFPISSAPRWVPLPTGPEARGPDGLRAGLVVYPRVMVDQGSPDAAPADRWQDIAAISAIHCVPPGNPGADVVVVDALDRVSWWLLGLVYDGIGNRPIGSPPEVFFEVRSAIVGASGTVYASGTISPTTWNDAGMIVQVSGILCSQWEIWMRVSTDEDPGTKIRLRVAGCVDRIGGGVLDVQFGTIVSVHTP